MALTLAVVARGLGIALRKAFPPVSTVVVASATVAALAPVRMADSTARTNQAGEVPHGISLAGAAAAGPCVVQLSGLLLGATSAADVGQLFWLTQAGTALTPVEPVTAGQRKVLMGIAMNATDVIVCIEDQGIV